MTDDRKTGASNKVGELLSERGEGATALVVPYNLPQGRKWGWVSLGGHGQREGVDLRMVGGGGVSEAFGISKYWACWGDHITRAMFVGQCEWSI